MCCKKHGIQYAGREKLKLPGEGARIDANKSHILDHSALLPEARFPHVFENDKSDESVAKSVKNSTGKYQL